MSREAKEKMANPQEVRVMTLIATEHNRQPGAFDYKYPQTFYSVFPELDQESYVTLGGTAKRRVHDE